MRKDRIDGDEIVLHVPKDLTSGVLKKLCVYTDDMEAKKYVIRKTSKGGIMLQSP